MNVNSLSPLQTAIVRQLCEPNVFVFYGWSGSYVVRLNAKPDKSEIIDKLNGSSVYGLQVRMILRAVRGRGHLPQLLLGKHRGQLVCR